MKRALAGLVIGLASICSIGSARANGRFPEAQQIESVPGDPSTLFLRATFGVLVSRDGGKRWQWICERALGYEGQWDPPIAVTPDGRLWVGLEDGLVSTRDGCEVQASPELDGHLVKDLTIDARGIVWAITGKPGARAFVWRQRAFVADGGRSAPFERLAGFDDTNLMTIDVAPSNASRVYLSGQPYGTIRGQIFRSTDGGATFATAKNTLEADGPFFIGAIDPADPSRLLIRHLHGKGSDLLLSRDGGKTFTNVLAMKSAMFGFAKSDGTYWAGSGLADDGIFRSTDRGEHFANVARHGVLCLHSATPDALFACENTSARGATTVAVSRDRGVTVSPLARFADIEGPVACATATAAARVCAGTWQETRATLAPELAIDAGAPVPSASATTPSRVDRPEPRSKCGCYIVGVSSSARAPLAAVLVLLLVGITRGSRRVQRSRRSGADRGSNTPF